MSNPETATVVKPEITVQKRSGDFHVHVKDKPGHWSCGTTIIQAIGTLVCDHPNDFGININYDNVK